ncbi:MAG: RNA polymerase sigma-70 factor [Bacteroidales bacterium]|nr:RNA polymerase sigma-70 factor [Bacteroidales bacterium]
MKSKEEILFNQFYLKYYLKIQHVAYSYLFDIESAKNVAQEVFLKLWDKRDIIDPQREVYGYLLILTKNACINILKRRLTEKKYKEFSNYRLQAEINLLSLSNKASEKIIEKEISTLLESAIKMMPEKVRSTFILSRSGDLKQKEIAEIQGIALRTVESRLKTAMEILKRVFKDYLILIMCFFAELFR